jgi:hypothetical protein
VSRFTVARPRVSLGECAIDWVSRQPTLTRPRAISAKDFIYLIKMTINLIIVTVVTASGAPPRRKRPSLNHPSSPDTACRSSGLFEILRSCLTSHYWFVRMLYQTRRRWPINSSLTHAQASSNLKRPSRTDRSGFVKQYQRYQQTPMSEEVNTSCSTSSTRKLEYSSN